MIDHSSIMKLYYVHDPMCSWCWAFRPVWQEIQNRLPADVEVTYLLGGLAPDTDAPMPPATQREIQAHWRTIQKKLPDIMFNFDFWMQNSPRRATYPACRAVIAAKRQNLSVESAMINAIQTAYYLEALNPSESDVLITCAKSIGLDVDQFRSDLNAAPTQSQLIHEIKQAQSMQVFSFPSLVLEHGGEFNPVHIDYSDAESVLAHIHQVRESC